MHDFWTPALLSRAAPDAKILVILRDPLARYRSGISHDVDVLKRRVRRRSHPYVGAMSANDALNRSLYARQLRRIFEHFDRERVSCSSTSVAPRTRVASCDAPTSSSAPGAPITFEFLTSGWGG